MEFPALSWGVCLLLLTLGAGSSRAASWSYKGDTGPKYWHELFPQECSGKHQSPINIEEERTLYDPNLRDFAIWFDPPKSGASMQVLNNGHTVQVVTNGEFHVTNAGLQNVYSTAQFHFHWGDAKHHGSEHLINGRAYPLELHIVNYNSDLYADIGEAVMKKQGLAVLGVMFEISDEDNKELEPVIAAMKQVQDPEDQNTVEIEPLSLRRLLPHDIRHYFRYNGSLTTPGCFETVIWTVFAKPQHISRRQMQQFREQLELRPKHGHHKRSVRDFLPATRRERRRERRALQVLDELALTPEQKERFRRDLVEKKEHAEAIAAKIDEQNAGESHRRTLEAVHVSVDHDDDDDDDDDLTEVEIEYIRENMVNNFRPVQPLNDRLVYRSFKLKDSEPAQHHHHAHTKHHSNLPDIETIRERLKMYESTDAAGPTVISLLLLVLSCLASLFL